MAPLQQQQPQSQQLYPPLVEQPSTPVVSLEKSTATITLVHEFKLADVAVSSVALSQAAHSQFGVSGNTGLLIESVKVLKIGNDAAINMSVDLPWVDQIRAAAGLPKTFHVSNSGRIGSFFLPCNTPHDKPDKKKIYTANEDVIKEVIAIPELLNPQFKVIQFQAGGFVANGPTKEMLAKMHDHYTISTRGDIYSRDIAQIVVALANGDAVGSLEMKAVESFVASRAKVVSSASATLSQFTAVFAPIRAAPNQIGNAVGRNAADQLASVSTAANNTATKSYILNCLNRSFITFEVSFYCAK